MTAAAPSKLPVDVCAPIAAGLVYLLTYPTPDGRALPSAEDAAARTWMEQVRALLQRACGADGARITHVVFSADCALASPVLALLQQSQAAQGLPAAELFHAEQAHSPRALLDELLRCWHDGAADADGDDSAAMAEAEADAALHTPTVSSPLFRRSLRETRLPRLLLLAPGLRHAFNEAIHLRMQALDANAHREQINADESHSYTTATAAVAAAATVADASDPQVACSSSVFGVALCAPVLLEYALYRSALTGVWSSMRRLERALEERLRHAAAAAEATQAMKGKTAPHSLTGRLPGTHYPSSLVDGGGAAASSFVVRPCRIYTFLGSHALHSVLLVAVDEATVAAAAADATAAADAKETNFSAPVLQSLQSLLERVSSLRAQSAWAGPRTLVFDDSPAGRALAAACTTAFGPAFAFRPSFLALASAMGVYDSIVHASPLAPLILFGAPGDLEPLLSLLLNQGRRANVAVDKQAVRAVMQRERGVVDVQHCHPELPSTLTTRSPMPPPIAPAAAAATDSQKQAARDRDVHAHSQSRFQVSRVLNAQYARLSNLPV